MAQSTVQRQIGHDATVLGADDVTRSQNTTGEFDTILELGCPRKYEEIIFNGGRHPTKFVPRTVQSVSGTANDDTVVSLDNTIVPISGEEEIADQPYPVAVAYNTTTGTQYDIVDVDYANNTVTLGTDPADGDTVKVWSVLSEGELKMAGEDVFENPRGSVQVFGQPIHVFADLNQLNKRNQPHLAGSATWSEGDTLKVQLESPHQIVWEDADYPEGKYVSTFQQTVQVR